jgi:hypothetical protein
MFSEYYSKYKIVKDLAKVTNDKFLKIAAYHFECSETYVLPAVQHLENEMQVTVSGIHWLDISHSHANKGFALNLLQRKLNFAFFSYSMKNVHPNVKKAALFKTKAIMGRVLN